MTSPNVIGYVVEVEENREVTPEYDDTGRCTNLIPGEVKVRLKLRLVNTLGKIREVWVEGPNDVVDFYSTELPDEIKKAAGV